MGRRDERRAEVEADILRVGREHLARYGAAALSLRAIARELDMVSSGIYRYVENRDELLTQLIIQAYTSLARAATAAHEAVNPTDLAGRWRAIGRAVREWAVANPQDFALIYGSPVPDYAAPAERTTVPGTAVLALLTTLLDDAHRAGRVPPPQPGHPRATLAQEAVGTFLDDEFFAATTLDHATLAVGLSAWTLVLGAVTSEVFNQLGPVADTTALFEWHLAVGQDLILSPMSPTASSTGPSTPVCTA